MHARAILPSLAVVTFLTLAAFAVLRSLQMPVGELIDWIMGIAMFWWLMIVVTVPWNMHFEAKEVLQEAKTSADRNIEIDERDLGYVRRIARLYLAVALGLHLVSAAGLYLLAYFGLTPLGYWAALAALLLTLVRPGGRMYAYVVYRLQAIRQKITYPREDVVELRLRVATLENLVHTLQEQLDTERPESWANHQQQKLKQVQGLCQDLKAQLADLKTKNDTAHGQLARQAENAMARLTEDAQFLNQARELIRFIKNA